MKQKLASGLAAILLAGTIISAPEGAVAQQRYHDQGQYHQRYDGDREGRGRWDNRGRYRSHRGNAAAAGVAGLVIGAILGGALSSRQNHRYDQRGYYGDGYSDRGYGYSDSYGYGRQPRTCITRQQRWDDYQGEYVWVEQAYPC